MKWAKKPELTASVVEHKIDTIPVHNLPRLRTSNIDRFNERK